MTVPYSLSSRSFATVRRCAAVVAVCVAFAGCGGAKARPFAAPAREGALPAGPPLVTPGERMSYTVSLQGVPLATYDLAIGEVEPLDGRRVVLVQSHAKVVGLAAALARVDDRFASWIDVETGRSRRFQSEEFETKGSDVIERVVGDLARRDGNRVPVAIAIGDAPAISESQAVNLPDVWDYNAFLVALRSWEQPAGSATAVDVFRSRWMWRIEVSIGGKELLSTELGELPSLRFDARAYKLDRAGARIGHTEPRELSVWISDDADRVPLRVVGRTDYGDVVVDIVAYDPGSGTRAR